MRRRTGAAIAAFIIAFISVWFPAEKVCAESEEYVYSFEELQDQLAEDGEATLGTNVTIPGDKTLRLSSRSIHTGDYGILIEGELELGFDATITGQGVASPVVEVLSGGSMYIGYSDFEDAPLIEATGNGGQALVLREGSEYGQSDSFSFLRVKANGIDGIAVESEITLDLKRHFIEAQNGTGIVCDQEVKLFLCSVSAGVSSLIAPDFTADTCDISPAAPANGTASSRKITKLDSEVLSNRGCVALGDPLPFYLNSSEYMGPFIATLHAEGYDDVFEDIYVTMDVLDINTNEIGLYPVEVCPEEWMRGFDLVPEDVVLYHMEVYDVRIPYYRGTLLSYYGTYNLNFWYRADDVSGLTLWRSDDEGESWYDFTDAADTKFDGEVLMLCFTEIPDYPVWFVWEAKGIGESKILHVTWQNADGNGGDRTGGDHGANTLPPTTMPGAPKPTIPDDDPKTIPPTTTPSPAPAVGTSESSTENIPPADAAQPTANETQTVPPSQTTSVPASSPVKPAEYADEKSVTVSGARLGVMIAANPAYVSFVCGELRVSLPTAFLKDLDNIDTFTVTLYRPSERNFLVSFAVDHKALTQRFEEAFIVRLPWRTGAISCVSENGKRADATLDGKMATFRLHETGLYTMMEQTVPAVAITDHTPLNHDPAPNTTEPVPPQNDDTGETGETPEPHSDSIIPVMIVGSVGILCVGAYLWFSRIRRVKSR